VANSKDPVLDAIARAEGKKQGAVKAELRDLITRSDSKQTLWFALPASALAKTANDDKAKKHLEKVENVTGGINVTDGVKFLVTITTKSTDAAKELADEIKEGLEQAKGILALLAAQQKELAVAVDLVGAIKITAEGKAVTMQSEVSGALIDKNLKKE
jgi:hypothetical protein